MIGQQFPAGWDGERVKNLIADMDTRSDEDWAAADEAAATDAVAQTVVTVPIALIPEVRRLIAAHNINSASGGRSLHYESLNPVSREDAEVAAYGAPEQLAAAIMSVGLHDEDLAWAESFCARLALHDSPIVRGATLLGFAHLARRFGELREDRVRPLIEAGLADADAEVRGQADDAADDIEMFTKWRVTRPV